MGLDLLAGPEAATAEQFGRLAHYLRGYADQQGQRAGVRSERLGQVDAAVDSLGVGSSSPRIDDVTGRIRHAAATAGATVPEGERVASALGHLADVATRTAAVIAEVERFERSWSEQLAADAQEWAGRLTDGGDEARTEQFRERTRLAQEASARREQAMDGWRRELATVVAVVRSATEAIAGRATADLSGVAPVGSVRPQADRKKVDEALATVRASLDPNSFGGVREDDLDRIRDTLAGLSGPELDAVIAGMTDEEIKRWLAEADESWIKGGWPEDRKRELLVLIGEKASIETWRRLATFTKLIDPPPSEGRGDIATGLPETESFFDSLRYERINAPLSRGPGNGFSVDDVQQGGLGDCHLIAAIKSVALHDPGALDRMIKANPNGTYTVTFADGSQVVVSADMPFAPDGIAFATDGAGNKPTQLWPSVIEKAYVQRYGGWGAVVGGAPEVAVERLTGRKADYLPASAVDIHDLARRWRDGEMLGISTLSAPSTRDERERWIKSAAPKSFRRGTRNNQSVSLVPNHAFVITDVDEAAGTVTVNNPWYADAEPIVLTESELRESIQAVQVNKTP